MINSAARSQLSGKKWYRNISAGNPLYSEMELISTVLVGNGGATTITFSSIPQDYKHLQIRATARSSRDFSGNSIDVYAISLNSVSATKAHWLYGTGSSVASTNDTYSALTVSVSSPATTSNAYTGSIFDILDYTNTSKNRVIRALSGHHISNNGNGDIGQIMLTSTLYLSTAATNTITIQNFTTFVAGSRFSLYGIKG